MPKLVFLLLAINVMNLQAQYELALRMLPDLSKTIEDNIGMGEYLKDEYLRILAENKAQLLGSLSLAEFHELRSRLDVASQKDAFLKDTVRLSRALPGAGQFRNGDWLQGVGFALLDLTLVSGTLAGIWMVLPADFRDSLINGRLSASRQLPDYLPAAGVLAAGWLGWQGLGFLAASGALDPARRAINEGRYKFEARISAGWFGFSLGW